MTNIESHTESDKERFVFLPLGGSGEIGMNMNLFGFGVKDKEKWIMVDCGVTFGDHETPGVDLITPDHHFIKSKVKDLIAIILTHAHEDHIGAIAHIWPDLRVPIYATAFTAKMVESKFADIGVMVGKALNVIPLKAKLSLRPFDIEFISITHSIPEPNGLLITTPLGKIYHTGDWKFDPDPVLGDATDFDRLHKLKSENILAVICDSTNALDAGVSGSEASILEPMIQEISAAKGGVAITTFASNVARVKTLVTAATRSGRKYAFLGRSLERIYGISREMGYFDGVPEPVPYDQMANVPKKEMVLLCTGSQGEDRAALGKLARGIHPSWKLSAGDTVIFSSKVIPGNEKPVSKILNRLAMQGVKVVTSKMADIHVSGHPCADELTELYETIKPKYAIPVHGEERHMQRHAQIALNTGVKGVEIPHNGDVIEIAPNFGWVGSVESGRLCVDGTFLDNAYNGATAERKRLGYAGCATIFLHLDNENNLIGQPEISTWGIPAITGSNHKAAVELYRAIIIEAFYAIEEHIMDKDNEIADIIKQSFRREVNRIWGKKPMTQVIIHKLNKNIRRKKNK
jgi:ribonuclease J